MLPTKDYGRKNIPSLKSAWEKLETWDFARKLKKPL